MKNIIYLTLMLLLSQSVVMANTSSLLINPKVERSQSYVIRGFNHGMTLTLTDKSTFSYEAHYSDCVGGTTKECIYGRYERNRNKIELFPEKGKRIVINTRSNQKDTFYLETIDRTTLIYYEVGYKEFNYLLSGKNIYYGNQNDFEGFLKKKMSKDDDDDFFNPYFRRRVSFSSRYVIDDLPEKWKKLLIPLNQVVYKVQLGAFKDIKNFDAALLAKYQKYISYLKTEAGLTLVLFGNFTTYKVAKHYEKEFLVRELEAITVAIKNGKKVSLSKVKY